MANRSLGTRLARILVFVVGPALGLITFSETAKADIIGTWQSLGGYVVGTPSAFYQGGQLEQVYVRGGDNAIWARILVGSEWLPWTPLGGTPASDANPVAALKTLYLRFSDNLIYKRDFIATNRTNPALSWGDWQLVPGSPTVVKDPVPFEMLGKRCLVAVGTDNRIWTNYPNGKDWTSISGFNIPISQIAVAANSTYDPRVDLFVRAENTIIYRATHANGRWQYWFAETGGFHGDPKAIRFSVNRTVVFARRQDASVAYFSLDRDRRRSALTNIGGYLLTDPQVLDTVGNENGSIEVFGLGFSGVLQKSAPGNGTFGPWYSIGGPIQSPLGVTCDRVSKQCDVFGIGSDSALWTARTFSNAN